MSQSRYNHEELGGYGFKYKPLTFPHNHKSEVQLMATTHHEQIHDMLARQTTHGYALLLAQAWLEKKGEEKRENSRISSVLLEVIEAGRNSHERYATFATFCASKEYKKLAESLPYEYKKWSAEAAIIIPKELKDKRIGRVFLYSIVLAVLNPKLTKPNEIHIHEEILLKLLKQVLGIEERWHIVSRWAQENECFIHERLFALAIDHGYSKNDCLISNGSEYDTIEEKDLLITTSFLEKERSLITELIRFINNSLDNDLFTSISFNDLENYITPYRDLLVPKFKLSPLLVKLGILDKYVFGELHQKFQEEPLVFTSGLRRSLKVMKSGASFYKTLEWLLNEIKELHQVGYVSTSLSKEVYKLCEKHIPSKEGLFIQWSLLHSNVKKFEREALQQIIIFDIQGWMNLVVKNTSNESTSLITSPFSFEAQKSIRDLFNALSGKLTMLYLIQPFNFLNLLEWRIEHGNSFSYFLVRIYPIPGELVYFAITKFENEDYEYIQIITQTAVQALYNLQRHLNEYMGVIIFTEDQFPTRYIGPLNFLKLFWRKGFLTV